ncbi:MAG: Na+/H+ antiporter subunit E [Lachnospiraceae bacterium]|jgi:multicomponent Na+:H+ antiporter subunit E
MYILFLAFWILLNGRFTAEILIFGIFISAAIYFFICKFMDFSFKKDLMLVKSAGLMIRFIFILIKEIAKANFNVIKLIMSTRYEPEPEVVYFTTDLRTGFAKTMLANAITLTPGTITVSVVENEFCIHCLDKEYAEGIENSDFVRILRKMEAKWK